MSIGDDFSITFSTPNYNIRHVSGSTQYTVLELFRWLGSLSDDAAYSGNDEFDITVPKLAERVTDVEINLLNGANIDDTAAQYLYGGSISQESGDVLYSGLRVVGAVEASTQPIIVQDNAILTSWWGTGLNPNADLGIIMQILVKSRDAGADIDGKRIRLLARELSDSYAYFDVLLGTGVSVGALFTSNDGNNQTAEGTISGWSDISYTAGLRSIDLNNGNGAKKYLDEWDRASRTMAQFYERTKWLQRRGTVSTIHGMNGQLYLGITHVVPYSAETGAGAWTQDEELTWGSGATAGSGVLLAVDDLGTTGTIYMQMTTGVAPTNGLTITGVSSAKTCTAGTPTKKVPPNNFIGVFTGTAINPGAFGVGIQATDLTVADKLVALDSSEQSPPNNQQGVVTGLTVGEDYVLVAPSTGDGSTAILYGQLNAAAGNNSGNGTLVVQEAIPADTPVSGTVRIWNGVTYDKLTYTSWATSTFTLSGTLPRTYSAGDDVFISYIDKLAAATSESFTGVYQAPRYMAVLVRDGGATPKKEFLSPATFGSAGFSVPNTSGADV